MFKFSSKDTKTTPKINKDTKTTSMTFIFNFGRWSDVFIVNAEQISYLLFLLLSLSRSNSLINVF